MREGKLNFVKKKIIGASATKMWELSRSSSMRHLKIFSQWKKTMRGEREEEMLSVLTLFLMMITGLYCLSGGKLVCSTPTIDKSNPFSTSKKKLFAIVLYVQEVATRFI